MGTSTVIPSFESYQRAPDHITKSGPGDGQGVRSLLQRRPGSTGASSDRLFGPFRLVPTQFLLLDRGTPVPLGSRAMELLIALTERPGELLSKQDLIARVWPGVFVDPANLTVHICALRRVLRDGEDGNRFIVNIPGRGYIFVTPVAETQLRTTIVSEFRTDRQNDLFKCTPTGASADDADTSASLFSTEP